MLNGTLPRYLRENFRPFYVLANFIAFIAGIVGVIFFLLKWHIATEICFWICIAEITMELLFGFLSLSISKLCLAFSIAALSFWIIGNADYWTYFQFCLMASGPSIVFSSRFFLMPSKIKVNILEMSKPTTDLDYFLSDIPLENKHAACYTEVWRIGEEIDLDEYQNCHEPFSRKLYLIVLKQDDDATTQVVSKAQWKRYKKMFEQSGLL